MGQRMAFGTNNEQSDVCCQQLLAAVACLANPPAKHGTNSSLTVREESSNDKTHPVEPQPLANLDT